VLALAQAWISPWVQLAPVVVAVVLVNGSLIGDDNYLPEWLGFAGLAFVVAATILGFFIPRRMLLRTDEHVYLFALPRQRKDSLEAPLGAFPLGELPLRLSEDSRAELGEERLWPLSGARRERDAIGKAIEPAR